MNRCLSYAQWRDSSNKDIKENYRNERRRIRGARNILHELISVQLCVCLTSRRQPSGKAFDSL
jgi:hypothetical protein